MEAVDFRVVEVEEEVVGAGKSPCDSFFFTIIELRLIFFSKDLTKNVCVL